RGRAGCRPVGEEVGMAGRIRDEDIALVRERTSIVDVISEQVTLKSAGGGNLKGLCPFHGEKSPSFNVPPARNVFFCFGCGARGFDRSTAERYGCGFAPDAWDRLTKHLRQKGYTGQELVTAGLAKEARSGSLIDRFRRRLIWPIKDLGGDVIGFGARKLYDD